MAEKIRYLTKSRFKVGHECPTKLHYYENGNYGSTKDEDSFLKSLADGGFQVGALAKLYFPDGIEIHSRSHEEAVFQTQLLLAKENVVIFEAAIRYENCFVRVDILRKRGELIEIFEVKAKSWDEEKSSLTTAKGALDGRWEPYIADIAFQKWVASRAFPQFKVTCKLMLANKAAQVDKDGLHQRFHIKKVKDQTQIEVEPGTDIEIFGNQILVTVEETGAAVLQFIEMQHRGLPFDKYIQFLADLCINSKKDPPQIGRICKDCEFRINKVQTSSKKSGFEECWSSSAGFKKPDFEKPHIFDIWNLHFTKTETFLNERSFFMSDLAIEDLRPETVKTEIGMPRFERQWRQVVFATRGEAQPYIDIKSINEIMQTWIYPLHFIDFETITAAIPFHRGLHPYETIAFQFSHHTVDRNGQVSHQTEYINTAPGAFPNFEFARRLKAALANDQGTVFRYAGHENTVLLHIQRQILESNEPDKSELVDFINTLTISNDSKKKDGPRRGSRSMIDLLDLVLRFYISPLMGGSNSIKAVLPAILRESRFLQNKYSKPIYGAAGGITSKNFKNKIWFKEDSAGHAIDPYEQLGPAMNEQTLYDEEIRDGGAASTAYARMQFTRMGDIERQKITASLLRYCELDTLAMVMIYEYWRDLVNELG